MPPVIHSHKGKRSEQSKRTNRHHDKDKSRFTMSEGKECYRKNEKYNVIIEDFVLDYIHPENATANLPTTKTIQKRKLPNDDDYDWDWAPYPRRIKTQRHDVSLYDGYMSDEFEASQVVPDWNEVEQASVCLSASDVDNDDSLNSKTADIRIVTIDEVIEFETIKKPSGCHNFDAEPMCFAIEELCEIVGPERRNEKDSLVDEQKNALELLVAFTKNSRLLLHEDDGHESLKALTAPCSTQFDCNESCEDEDYSIELQNDCRIEEFKFARCFKCRRKVYNMQDCPRHHTKGTTTIMKHIT